MIFRSIMNTPCGNILLEAENDQLIGCRFIFASSFTNFNQETPFLQNVKKQLEEYFSGTRKSFDIKLAPAGTAFQQSVWQALQKIPYGRTASYKDIAEKIHNSKAFRAVGMANNKNPIAIIIPCHRVIGSNGRLVGYAGGLDLKQQLLELEKNNL